MREPWSALRRADAIILHRRELCADPDAWEDCVAQRARGVPRIWARNTWGDLRSLRGEACAWDTLRALRLGLWTALASPESLLAALEREGVHPVRPWLERDHACFDAAHAERLRSISRTERLDGFLVTAKDAVKMELWAAELPPVFVLHARFEFVAGPTTLDEMLRSRLGPRV
jgi:tetraacyldisaccharide-1-P 4'-kinase